MGKRLKNSVIYILVRLLMGLVRRMSLKFSLGFGRWLGRRAYRLARKDRMNTHAHLKLAFPDKTDEELESLAWSTFEHFGMAAAECVNVHKIKDLAAYMELGPESRKVIEDQLAKGRGLIIVSAHCGNWELMARALARLGFPINTIGKKSYDLRFTRLISKFRDEGPVRTIWRGEPDVTEKMVAVLKRGEGLGLLIDQDTKVPGVFVPFFGKPAYTPSVAAQLARKTGAAVVVCLNHRKKEGGGRIVIEEYVPCDLPDPEAAVVEDTAQLTARIENHIRAHPAEWVWMHRRWKTQP
jgi:KDO2-lipid IV(A) lauroyltransferase